MYQTIKNKAGKLLMIAVSLIFLTGCKSINNNNALVKSICKQHFDKLYVYTLVDYMKAEENIIRIASTDKMNLSDVRSNFGTNNVYYLVPRSMLEILSSERNLFFPVLSECLEAGEDKKVLKKTDKILFTQEELGGVYYLARTYTGRYNSSSNALKDIKGDKMVTVITKYCGN